MLTNILVEYGELSLSLLALRFRSVRWSLCTVIGPDRLLPGRTLYWIEVQGVNNALQGISKASQVLAGRVWLQVLQLQP